MRWLPWRSDSVSACWPFCFSLERNIDFEIMAECRNLNETSIRAMNWIRVSAAVGGFLISGAMLVAVMIRQEFKTVIQRLFIYLLLATLFREAVLFSNIEHQFEYEYMNEVCAVIGAFNHYTSFVVIIIVAATVLYLLGRVVGWEASHQKSKEFTKHLEIGFLVSTFLFPLCISTGLLYTDIFGLSIAWCWMQQYDNECNTINAIYVKKIFGGYNVIFLSGFLNVFCAVAMVVIYCRIKRRLKKATHLLKQPLIILICFIVNLFILIFTSIVIITPLEENHAILYVYTIVVSVHDVIYPLGFLFSLKYQTLVRVFKTRKKCSSYTPIRSNMSPTSPFSDRVSARSTTVPVTAPYTGEFTAIESNFWMHACNELYWVMGGEVSAINIPPQLLPPPTSSRLMTQLPPLPHPMSVLYHNGQIKTLAFPKYGPVHSILVVVAGV